MFDYQTVKMLHRHGGDDWVPMSEGSDHSPVAHDPERAWLKGARIFKCDRCDDQVVIADPGADIPLVDPAERL